MKKVTLVINGAGGVGKDTLCDLAAKHIKIRNISTITPIKEIAAMAGWDGRKDDKSRKFLADLKALSVAYNDFPTKWALTVRDEFMTTDEEMLIVHIREPEEIAKFVRATDNEAKTLLVRGGSRVKRNNKYGNDADDCVENYFYDYYFDNDKSFADAERDITELFRNIIDGNDMQK